jgi:ankyrin repeat protein
VIKVLVDHGAKVDIKGKNGATAVAVAKNIDAMNLLIAHGANIDDVIPSVLGKDVKLTSAQSTLLKAVVTGSAAGAETAAARHTDVDHIYPGSPTTLEIAVLHQRTDIVDWLLNRRIDANLSNVDGHTPLHLAAVAGYGEPSRQVRIMRLLLDHGALVDAVDKDGFTPLHMAAALYNKDAALFLLSKGADPLKRNKAGLTPIQVAQRSQHGTAWTGGMMPSDVKDKAAMIDALRVEVSKRPLPH